MNAFLESEQPLIEKIRLRDFRCFHAEQVVPLTPLTLLVGENSTGKTSFLAAVKAIWETAFRTLQPSFREEPYDLGSFSEIVHNSNRKGMKPSSFDIGFTARLDATQVDYDVTFLPGALTPYPSVISIRCEEAWIKIPCVENRLLNLEFGTKNGAWRYHENDKPLEFLSKSPSTQYWSGVIFLLVSSLYRQDQSVGTIESIGKNEIPCSELDIVAIDRLLKKIRYPQSEHVFAGAPIRSSPHRIYDPATHSPDPAGSHVPGFLAEIYGDRDQWGQLKAQLERFGRDSGLFHEIGIRRFEDIEGSPFRLEVSKENGNRRNLIDVGYGISQVLPVIYELFRKDSPSIFLFQQPEVHLHPSAQAALGSLFCDIASSGRQVIVETHSDYILDRILLDVRDKRKWLIADNVSILYFENEGGHASIHPIQINDEGNVLETPDGYRKFFKKELDRLINY